MASMPSSAVRANISPSRAAPSSMEYSVCTCRCTKPSLDPDVMCGTPSAMARCNGPGRSAAVLLGKSSQTTRLVERGQRDSGVVAQVVQPLAALVHVDQDPVARLVAHQQVPGGHRHRLTV